MKETPKISIVTVTYNCKDTVEKTIQNVLKQTYPNIEYIVIDGNSTDGTKEIIERYADRLAYWVSEPDKGIFDAMNKAIRIATGEWILFLNSGDYFIKPTIIDEVFKWYNDNGETLIAGGTRNYIKEGYIDCMYKASDKDVWDRPVFRHQGTFARLSIHKKYLFPTEFRIAGDYYVFMQMMLNDESFVVYDGVISLFENEMGASTRLDSFTKLWNERLMAMKMLGASESKIKETIRKRNKMAFLRKIMSVVSLFPFIYNAYRRREYTLQPLEITLKDI